MALFEQIRDMARAAAEKTEVIAKSVGEKAEAALEIQKLSSAIGREQALITKEYEKIGEYMYKKFTEGESAPAEAEEHFANITAAYAEIDALNKKIAKIKVEKFSGDIPRVECPECGKHIVATAKFCPECGAKIENKFSAEETPAVEATLLEEPEAAPKAAEAKEQDVQTAEIVKEEKHTENK